MGLNASAISHFRVRIDNTLRELFPADLLIGGTLVTGSGPGGKAISTYIDGGQNHEFRFPFRVPRDACPILWTPAVGSCLNWKIDENLNIDLEIVQSAVHPFEDVWEFVAKPRRA